MKGIDADFCTVCNSLPRPYMKAATSNKRYASSIFTSNLSFLLPGVHFPSILNWWSKVKASGRDWVGGSSPSSCRCVTDIPPTHNKYSFSRTRFMIALRNIQSIESNSYNLIHTYWEIRYFFEFIQAPRDTEDIRSPWNRFEDVAVSAEIIDHDVLGRACWSCEPNNVKLAEPTLTLYVTYKSGKVEVVNQTMSNWLDQP